MVKVEKAVVPDLQNKRIGSELVWAGLAECRPLGVGAVFVLGHPDYYPRFGFQGAAQFGLRYKNIDRIPISTSDARIPAAAPTIGCAGIRKRT